MEKLPFRRPSDPSIWKGRPAQDTAYYYQAIQLGTFPVSSSSPQAGLLGYAGDEGVRRNLGRPGAELGPTAIRQGMAGMAYHLSPTLSLHDFGDVLTVQKDLEGSHQTVSTLVTSLLNAQVFPILLGGGHDLAYPHAKGILAYLREAHPGQTLGIVNLDAHLDLRPTNPFAHSGSPFYQLGMEAQKFNKPFHYACLGVQKAANPPSLLQTARQWGVRYLPIEEYQPENWAEVERFMLDFLQTVDKVYLSIDLDGFSSAYAPGVSAPSPMGFGPQLALKTLRLLAQSGQLISMDVVELNPQFDQDSCTARLAARLIDAALMALFPPSGV